MVLGVTGGIAAFKMLELVQVLKRQGLNVVVIETPSACKIVPPKEFKRVTANKVLTQLFEKDFNYQNILKARRVEHVDIAQSASLIVIAPATANVIAKLASGIADGYLTTTVLAATCPIMIYPSMNTVMWRNPITQKNITTLRSFGMQVITPASGVLACGTQGEGRLPPVASIANEVNTQLNHTNALRGKRILVTAGGTSEPIDSVRLLTNRSSGKMGVAIAEECFLRGADVFVLRSRTSILPRYSMKEYLFDSADDLEQLMKTHIPHVDICFHVAAVSDFSIKATPTKLSSQKSHNLTLHPRHKIIDAIKKINPNIFLVAFKAEAGFTDTQLIKIAKEKLKESKADMVVANHIDRPNQGFGTDTNEVFIVSKENVTHIPLATKHFVAQKILDLLKASPLKSKRCLKGDAF